MTPTEPKLSWGGGGESFDGLKTTHYFLMRSNAVSSRFSLFPIGCRQNMSAFGVVHRVFHPIVSRFGRKRFTVYFEE